MSDLSYQTGFANHFASEALPGALPEGRNSPQRCAYGLYAEQTSGTAFTAPRAENRRVWTYRIRPAAIHGEFAPYAHPSFHNDWQSGPVPPDQMRWSPLPMPSPETDFIDGLFSMGGNGGPEAAMAGPPQAAALGSICMRPTPTCASASSTAPTANG